MVPWNHESKWTLTAGWSLVCLVTVAGRARELSRGVTCDRHVLPVLCRGQPTPFVRNQSSCVSFHVVIIACPCNWFMDVTYCKCTVSGAYSPTLDRIKFSMQRKNLLVLRILLYRGLTMLPKGASLLGFPSCFQSIALDVRKNINEIRCIICPVSRLTYKCVWSFFFFQDTSDICTFENKFWPSKKFCGS